MYRRWLALRWRETSLSDMEKWSVAGYSHCNSSSLLCQHCWLLTAPRMVMQWKERAKTTRGTPPSFLFLHSTQTAVTSARNIIIQIQNVIRDVMYCRVLRWLSVWSIRAPPSCKVEWSNFLNSYRCVRFVKCGWLIRNGVRWCLSVCLSVCSQHIPWYCQ
jgi:hypothetical protein